jgi:ribosomal protein S18 acetylase RimI-like enzyme
LIEQARKEDVQEVMPLLLAAIGNIAYTLAGTEEHAEAEKILADFYRQEDNRISYKHVIVDRREDGIAGMLLSYGGDHAAALDIPFVTRIGRDKGARAKESIAVEAQAGDYYLDSIAVDARYQGQGIATALIEAFAQKGVKEGCSRLSLIVEPYNERAYSLYQRLNFIEDGSIVVSGSRYIRMIKPL